MNIIDKKLGNKIISYMMSILTFLSVFFQTPTVNSQTNESETSSGIGGCSINMKASYNLGIPDLHRPVDLVFIVDASGSMNNNPTGSASLMSSVKSMINTAIDKYVDPSLGDRVMVTSFQGSNYSVDSVTGDSIFFGQYIVTSNTSGITSDVNQAKTFVNNIVANSGTPTTQGIYEAINKYNDTAGDTSNRLTVPVLITDGVMTVAPATNNRVVDSTRLRNYWDEVRQISTYYNQTYDYNDRLYYNYYYYDRPTYSVGSSGELIETGTTREYWREDASRRFRPQASISGRYTDLLHYDTSVPWQTRLSEIVTAGQA